MDNYYCNFAISNFIEFLSVFLQLLNSEKPLKERGESIMCTFFKFPSKCDINSMEYANEIGIIQKKYFWTIFSDIEYQKILELLVIFVIKENSRKDL